MKTSKAELMKHILADECPFCEQEKRSGSMFCEACYEKLPLELQNKIKNHLRPLGKAIIEGVKFLEDAK